MVTLSMQACTTYEQLLDLVGASLKLRPFAIHFGSFFAEDGKRALCDDDELVRPILGALRTPRQKVQRIVIETLRVLFEGDFRNCRNIHLLNSTAGKLRAPILEGLLGLLKSRRASDVFASSTTLRLLAPDSMSLPPIFQGHCVRLFVELVCDEVVKNGAFWELSNEYYNVLNLVYDKKGPKFGTSWPIN
ncbi:hypothetical protein BS17DRAFT_325024 [Gyrodon lividus]|nr:hypothetical protein BS17DRAFT_325024 [Gyrodon lividus]